MKFNLKSFYGVEIVSKPSLAVEKIKASLKRCEKEYTKEEIDSNFREYSYISSCAFDSNFVDDFSEDAFCAVSYDFMNEEERFIMVNTDIIEKSGLTEREVEGILWHEWHHVNYNTGNEAECDKESINRGYKEELKSALLKLMNYVISKNSEYNLDEIIFFNITKHYTHRTFLIQYLSEEKKEKYYERMRNRNVVSLL